MAKCLVAFVAAAVVVVLTTATAPEDPGLWGMAHAQRDAKLTALGFPPGKDGLRQYIAARTASGEPPLTVHVVAHTHDDVGWLKNPDEYYYGAKNNIQNAGVQYILDSVIPALVENPERKFIYVEIAFFERWWNEQSDSMKATVKGLVANRQLEFINGGITMNDEAATHYVDIIDQMTRGHKFILETFGPAANPTIGWHIDPFGHSSTQAELFAKMGFAGFFFGRIDLEDRALRFAERNIEFVWRPSPSLGTDGQIFSGVTFVGYSPNPGLNYNYDSWDTPPQNDPLLEDYNMNEIGAMWADWAYTQSLTTRTPNVQFTMGSDFHYKNANTWFKNLDKMLDWFKNDPNGQKWNLNVVYSTPSLYLKAVLNSGVTDWTVKTDDFFPYADDPHGYWTGYFTSRPALKGYVHDQSSYLQVCKQLEVIVPAANRPSSGVTSDGLADAMAIAQHHDAVSGTSKQAVAFDYAKRLAIGQTECNTLTTEALAYLQAAGSGQTTPQMSVCPLLNQTICPFTASVNAGATFAVTVYNSLMHAYRMEWVVLPVSTNK